MARKLAILEPAAIFALIVAYIYATVGFLLFLVVPDSISRHLNVGPAWFKR